MKNRSINRTKSLDHSNHTKFGLLFFLLINVSLIFLFLNPFLSNIIEKSLDEYFLEGIDERIREVRMDSFQIQISYSNGTPISNSEVEIELLNHDFFFGCNIFNFNQTGTPEGDQLYIKYFKNLFNLATIPFYWSQYEPTPGKYPRDPWISDVISWSHQNNITTKGHPLAWRNPAGYPDWLPEDYDKIEEDLQSRIERITNMYKDKIAIWDVVNEPTHLPSFGDWDNIEYLSKCFQWTDTNAPQAKLTVNDYGILGHDFGFGPYAQIISEALKHKIPIDYIGLQGREPRLNWIPARDIWRTLEAYGRFDLPIHITEFTCPSSHLPITNSWKKGLWTEENQAEYTKRMYKICFSHPEVEAIIWWDLWDGGSWVQQGGLLNVDFQPKPVYEMLERLINEEWYTQGMYQTDENGKLSFDGFFGLYNISLPGYKTHQLINAGRQRSNFFNLTI